MKITVDITGKIFLIASIRNTNENSNLIFNPDCITVPRSSPRN